MADQEIRVYYALGGAVDPTVSVVGSGNFVTTFTREAGGDVRTAVFRLPALPVAPPVAKKRVKRTRKARVVKAVVKRKRGRPRKVAVAPAVVPVVKRKPGRPRKVVVPVVDAPPVQVVEPGTHAAQE